MDDHRAFNIPRHFKLKILKMTFQISKLKIQCYMDLKWPKESLVFGFWF